MDPLRLPTELLFEFKPEYLSNKNLNKFLYSKTNKRIASRSLSSSSSKFIICHKLLD